MNNTVPFLIFGLFSLYVFRSTKIAKTPAIPLYVYSFLPLLHVNCCCLFRSLESSEFIIKLTVVGKNISMCFSN